MEAIPATLPTDLVGNTRVFEVTGPDFAGPVYSKNEQESNYKIGNT